MTRYVCIHGHFYQPPRENPWLEAVESQDSAYPYHDWNERITAECYAPNATSRILDEHGRIERITNNYARMSFDAGPTLLTWMAAKAPEVYARILEADRDSQQRFSGHGSAIAQAYNHIILPLANLGDRRTQVVWGIADFVHRFGRRPEGLWLAETAIDVESLELLVEHGIAFTVLAPHQARRVRPRGARDWREVDADGLDTRTPYELRLPSGRSISLFFYDGPTSRAVAFEGLLADGSGLAHRLAAAFDRDTTTPQLVHIATDGESYGHHHRHGDMALAFALQTLEASGDIRLTNYG
ncbi:MAG: glycoside hydrolase, partial [Actinomycetota bacterium]|nr:glycoside hydrolase [Actinomycetota bacterium]